MTIEETAKQNNISVEELKKVEEVTKKKYLSVANFLPQGKIDEYVTQAIKQHIMKYKNMDLTKYFGVILTMSSPKDGMAKRRSEFIRQYIENPDAAISAGLVCEYKDGMKRLLSKGIINSKPINSIDIPKNATYLPDQKVHIVLLDNRECWANGKKNFSYLNPLPIEQYFCNIEGLCSEDGSIWMPFKMVLNNCQQYINKPNITIPQSKLVTFMAKIKSKTPLILTYVDKYTKFEVVPGDITQIHEQIMNFYDITPLSDIKKSFDTRKTKYDITSLFGQVASKHEKLPTENNQYPTTTINIFDNTSEGTFKIMLHTNISAEFTEGSIVKVWGSISERNKWDSNLSVPLAEKEMMMFGTGVYAFTTNGVIEEQKSEDWGDEV